jgi:NADPH:quinone reductase-like Zn-dependent oxidoreductase
MPSSPKIESPEFAETVPIVEAAMRNTTKEALVREFGENRLIEHADGQWEVKLKTVRETQKFDEMDQERKRATVARSIKASERAQGTHVTIRGADGNKKKVPEKYAEVAERIAHHKRTGKW